MTTPAHARTPTPTITAADLEDLGVCYDQCERFARAFPSGVTITSENWEEVFNTLWGAGVRKFDWAWRREPIPRKFMEPAQVALHTLTTARESAARRWAKVVMAAEEEYRAALRAAEAEYNKQLGLAWCRAVAER